MDLKHFSSARSNGPPLEQILEAHAHVETGRKPGNILLLVCFGIEGALYCNLYDSTYDPLDLLAYGSIPIPVFSLDELASTRGSAV